MGILTFLALAAIPASVVALWCIDRAKHQKKLDKKNEGYCENFQRELADRQKARWRKLKDN